MKIKPILLFSFLLISCSNSSNKGEYLGASASFKDDNSILFGDPINKEDFTFTLRYEKKDVVLKPKDFDISLSTGTTFTNEDIIATLTYKKDSSIKTSVTINTKVRDSLKVLFIGNSFSDDTIQWMYEIAEDLGIDVVVENMYIGGCTIEKHYENICYDLRAYEWVHRKSYTWLRSPNIALAPIIASQEWDFISFQQASGSSGVSSTYSELSPLIKEVQKHLTNKNHTQFVWNMTWAYQGNSTHDEFPKYNSDQLTMYNAICDSVKECVLPLDDIKTIIPNGTSIQNARTSYIGDNLTRDGYHLSLDLGRYIAGLTAIKALTGADIDKCLYSEVDKSQTQVAKESVNNAIKKNFEITPSIYK